MERDYLKELADHKNAEKRYKITSLERRQNHLFRSRNRSLYMTGLLLLMAAAIPVLNQSATYDYIQIQIGAITSFSALKQYFEMLGPVSTMCCGGAVFTSAKSVVSEVKRQRTIEELEMFLESYESENQEELDSPRRR